MDVAVEGRLALGVVTLGGSCDHTEVHRANCRQVLGDVDAGVALGGGRYADLGISNPHAETVCVRYGGDLQPVGATALAILYRDEERGGVQLDVVADGGGGGIALEVGVFVGGGGNHGEVVVSGQHFGKNILGIFAAFVHGKNDLLQITEVDEEMVCLVDLGDEKFVRIRSSKTCAMRIRSA